MSDLISREAAIAIFQPENSAVRKRICDDLRALPAAPADVIKARALLSPWLETPNEGDPMIDVLLGVIREAHAAMEGGEA